MTAPFRRFARMLRANRRAANAAFAGGIALAAATGGALAGAASIGAGTRDVTLERRLYLMGTEASLAVSASDRAAALMATERAVRALETTEARLSTWRPESELSRLNRAPVGSLVPLSPALAAELTAALGCAESTGSAFDPVVGRLVDLWDLRGRGRVPEAAEIAAALPASRTEAFELRGRSATRHHPKSRIEEGAWGKGAAVDRALAALEAAPGAQAAWLDLGGQAAVLGQSRWTATLADPDDRGRPVVVLELVGGSLSTSGNGEHALAVDGRRVGHLLDPRTGAPAPDFGSVSVWAPRGLLADCLSTGLFVMGPEAALAWAAAHPGIEVAILQREGTGLRLRASAGLAGRVRALVPDLPMSFEATKTKEQRAVPPGSEGPPLLDHPRTSAPAPARGQ